MRVLLLTLALALAGCTGAEEPTPASSASPEEPETTAAAPVASPAPAPPAASNASSSPPASSSSATPSTSYSNFWTHQHANGARVETFDVPANASPAGIAISFLPTFTNFECASVDARVTLASPLGVVLSADADEIEECGGAKALENATMTAGRWTLWFNGTSDVTSMVAIGNRSREAEPFSFEAEHDYADEDETVRFDVPADAGILDLRLAFEPSLAAACLPAPEVRILLEGPGETREHVLGPLTGADGCGEPRVETAIRLAPGSWSATFSGAGSVRGSLTVGPTNS